MANHYEADQWNSDHTLSNYLSGRGGSLWQAMLRFG